jgi:hypothetical protein
MTRYRWQFVVAALALAGFVPSVRPTPAQAQGLLPWPADVPAAPKSFVLFDFLPGPGRWVSTVDNFDGIVAVANIQGTGKDNKGNTLAWEVDIRAMQGIYIGRNRRTSRGTFVLS